jgi:hypothetical protein
MSTRDTMTPLTASPWLDASGRPLSLRSLPGLRPNVLKTLPTPEVALSASEWPPVQCAQRATPGVRLCA